MQTYMLLLLCAVGAVLMPLTKRIRRTAKDTSKQPRHARPKFPGNQLVGLKTQLQSYTYDGKTIFMSFTNAGYLDYVRNLHVSCLRNGCAQHLVMFCLDDESMTECARLGIKCVRYSLDDVSQKFESWGSNTYKRIMFVKFEIIYCLLEMGLNVLYTDSDIVFTCNIVNKMSKIIGEHRGADVIMQNDSTMGDADKTTLCAGFCFMRASAALLSKMHPDTYDYSLENNDQHHFNVNIRQHVNVVALPQREFPNGFCIYKHARALPEYAMMHFNYVIGHKKRDKMRQYGAWYV